MTEKKSFLDKLKEAFKKKPKVKEKKS